MKKIMSIMMIICVLVINCMTAFANAGPVNWAGKDAYELYLPEKSTLEVLKEELIFDFSKGEKYHSAIGEVYVKYRLKNNSQEIVKQHMIFPFIGSIKALSDMTSQPKLSIIKPDKRLSIKMAGDDVPFELLIGDTKIKEEKSFDELLAAIKPKVYEYKNVNPKDAVYINTIKFNTLADERIVFEAITESENTDALYLDGIGGWEASDDGYYAFRELFYKSKDSQNTVTIGKVSDYTMNPAEVKVNFYADIDRKEKVNYQYTVSVKDLKLIDFVRELAQRYVDENEWIKDSVIKQSQVEYLTAEVVDCSEPFFDIYRLDSEFNENRHLFLSFDIELYPGEETDLVITYPVETTKESVRFGGATHTVKYFFSPAKNWKSFKDLTVSVITSEELPYVIESSVEFEQDRNVYTYKSEKLPMEDLTFSLYDKKRMVEPIIWPILFICIFLIVGFVFLYLRKRITLHLRRKKKRRVPPNDGMKKD